MKINYGSSDLFSRIMRQYTARVLSHILSLAVQNYSGITIPEEQKQDSRFYFSLNLVCERWLMSN